MIEHRNSLETWSADAEIVISGNSVSYDFTNSSAAAFGNNLIQADTSPELYAVYSGDVNGDDAIDLSDLSLIDNDAAIFLTGYINTDLNGDGLTDIADYLIAENNAFAFIAIIRP
ncbi:MAG: hypothetical protein IPM96_04895 [Ignavibacteria bacterium]|nr:hypothetical protein [Ignavibacteria bacterium]